MQDLPLTGGENLASVLFGGPPSDGAVFLTINIRVLDREFDNYVRAHRNPPQLLVTIRAVDPSGRRAQGCWVRQVNAGDADDGLPRGFLVGAIVKVLVAHRFNRAGDLLGRRGEELPRDLGSELRCLEVATSRGLRRLRHAGDEL